MEDVKKEIQAIVEKIEDKKLATELLYKLFKRELDKMLFCYSEGIKDTFLELSKIFQKGETK